MIKAVYQDPNLNSDSELRNSTLLQAHASSTYLAVAEMLNYTPVL